MGLTGVLEVEIKRSTEDKPVHEKFSRVSPTCGDQFVVEKALKEAEIGEKAEDDADEHHVQHEGEHALPRRGDEHPFRCGPDDVLRQRTALDNGHRVLGHAPATPSPLSNGALAPSGTVGDVPGKQLVLVNPIEVGLPRPVVTKRGGVSKKDEPAFCTRDSDVQTTIIR